MFHIWKQKMRLTDAMCRQGWMIKISYVSDGRYRSSVFVEAWTGQISSAESKLSTACKQCIVTNIDGNPVSEEVQSNSIVTK